MAKQKARPMRRKINVPKNCWFCSEKKEPVFSDTGVLQRFVTERGKIIPRSRSGLCNKHQRALSAHIKYARHLALLPFVVRS